MPRHRPAPPPNPPPPPALSPRRAAMLGENLRRATRLVWQVDRGTMVPYALSSLLDALIPVVFTYAGKRIVDAVVLAARDPAHGAGARQAALTWVVLELALFVLRQVNGQYAGFLSTLLRARLAVHVDELIIRKALALSLRHFEDPEFMNRLERARRDSGWRPVEVVTHGLALGKSAVTLAGLAALLLQFSAWAVLALALAALPVLGEMGYAGEQYAIKQRRTQDERKQRYLQNLLSSDWYAKELKLFALGGMLLERYQSLAEQFFAEDRAFARRRAAAVSVLGVLSALVFYGVYASVVVQTAAGAITLGSMTLYLSAFRQGQQSIQAAVATLARAYEDNLYLGNLFEFLATPSDDDVPLAFGPEPARGGEAPELRFESVSFAYPGSERACLSGVDFTVAPGETVALVGPNGAGKTTLVKLLTGLYAPTEGRVLLGGEDTAAMDRRALRARIGVVFQDFVHYHFSAADNVGIGWLPAMGDRARIERAAQQAGADAFLRGLPRGYDTTLGRWFGGEQLSVGQWQRVALARAFIRNSDVLVLDEPTAAIDAEGEHEIFERFLALKAGRTAILITHRFSTVRLADRIVVLDGGRVAEQGTHAELVAKGGLYARMFRLQAQGYLDAG